MKKIIDRMMNHYLSWALRVLFFGPIITAILAMIISINYGRDMAITISLEYIIYFMLSCFCSMSISKVIRKRKQSASKIKIRTIIGDIIGCGILLSIFCTIAFVLWRMMFYSMMIRWRTTVMEQFYCRNNLIAVVIISVLIIIGILIGSKERFIRKKERQS